MPIFLDTHHGSELAPDRIREFLRNARNAVRDRFGVRPLDLYCGDDGRVFYVVAAPDEATVRQQHAAEGVVCRRVRRVESSHPMADELGEEEKTTVRHMIAAEHAWPAQAAS
jgi:asparagine synthetase B (glutamine-hydrolysing)